MQYSDEQVLKAIQGSFPDQNSKDILELLQNYQGNEPNRVYIAILKLSAGDEKKLLTNIEEARKDYRDILFFAEYERDGTEIKDPYKDLLS